MPKQKIENEYERADKRAARADARRKAKEICKCEHSRIAHAGPEFHGRCLVGKSSMNYCDCPKFTWARVEA